MPGRQYKIRFEEQQQTERDTEELPAMDYNADDDEDIELFPIAELGGVAEDEFDVAAQRVASTAEEEIDLVSMDTLLFDEYESDSDSTHVDKIHRSASEDISSLGSFASIRSISDSGTITPSPTTYLGSDMMIAPAVLVKLEEFTLDFDVNDEYAIDFIKLESDLDTTVEGTRRKRKAAKKAIRDFHEV